MMATNCTAVADDYGVPSNILDPHVLVLASSSIWLQTIASILLIRTRPSVFASLYMHCLILSLIEYKDTQLPMALIPETLKR